MGLEFYYNPLSSPCRAVWMTLKALGVDFNKHTIDVLAGEQKTEEFKKINPQQAVPTIVDGDFHLWESRAIMTYLCDKCDSEGNLHPKDIKMRALIVRALYMDMAMYANFLAHLEAIMKNGAIDEALLEKARKDVAKLEENRLTKYIVGDSLTIADFCVLTSLSMMEAAQFDCSPYPKLCSWMKTIKSLPYFDECSAEFYAFLKSKEEEQKAKKVAVVAGTETGKEPAVEPTGA